MELTPLLYTIFTLFFILQHSSTIDARYHYHKNPKKSLSSPVPPPDPKKSSASPVPPPALSAPPRPSLFPPDNSPSTVPSDPYPGDNSGSDENNDCTFNVTTYGAVGDGVTDDTTAFREAWKVACAVESATVLAPEGYTFMITSTIFSGPCKPGLVFRVNGIVTTPQGPEEWPKEDSQKQWLVFYRLDGFTLTGSGTIEGNGEPWWDLPCKPHRGPNGKTLSGPCDSPAMIRFFMSSNLAVSGLTIQDSPMFHMKFDGCDGVHIEKLVISSPKLSPNTDGIHIENTKSVGIYDTMIGNGDDCISIGSGCSDVHIEGVTCGPSHGISIGSLGVHNSRACVSNITVRNVLIRESDNGLRVKTWQGGSGSVTGITFENIQMENVQNCINVNQYYCMSNDCSNQTSAVYVTDVAYRNIKGTYNVLTPPIHFACSDSVPCTNITMSEVELLPHMGQLVDDPFCWNAYGNKETPTIPPIDCLIDGMPETVAASSTEKC